MRISISGCGCIGVVLAAIMSFWTQRNLDFWLTYFSHPHHEVHIRFIWCLLLAVLGPVTILCNVIAEIARQAIGF